MACLPPYYLNFSDQSVPNPVCSVVLQREMRTVTFVGNDAVLIVDNSKFIAQAYSRVLLGLGYRLPDEQTMSTRDT